MAISPNILADDEIALSAMHDCIKDLKDDQESIEVEKTEFLLIGTKNCLGKLTLVVSL